MSECQVDKTPAGERQAESGWSFLFEEHPYPTWIYDVETLRFLAVNRAAIEQYGYTREEFLEMSLIDIRPSGDVERLRRNVEAENATVQISENWRHKRKDGSLFHVRIVSRSMRHGGREARLVVVYEIEKQVAAEQALDRSEKLRRVVWEKASRLMRVSDEHGTVISINEAYQQFAGLARTELEGRPFWIIYPDADQERMRLHYRERFQKRTLESVDERLVTLRDGRRLWLEMSNTFVQVETGTLLLCIMRDVTERKAAMVELERARQEADAANRAKSAFLANMSHEIRTPLNGVMGMISLVLEHCCDAEHREQLRVAQSAAKSLVTILNDILDLSKIEAGKMSLEALDFDLRALVAEALRTFDLPVREKGLDLTLTVADDCPAWVRGDPVRLRQVLVNLVGNAVKFTPAGRVQVSIRQGGPGVMRLEVRDTGIGIPSSKLGCIFDAFTQADGSHTRQFGGTGLGLAISRRLVTLMGGTVFAESEAGRGSRFVVELPLAGRPQRPLEIDPPQIPAAPIPKLDVLVAEDNAINQKVIRSMLERQGWKVTVAANGKEAYENFLRQRWNVILMDIQMPEVDGLEAARLIRREERFRPAQARTPIIALTAHASHQQHQQCLTEGMDAVITKPVNLRELLTGIGEVLQAYSGFK